MYLYLIYLDILNIKTVSGYTSLNHLGFKTLGTKETPGISRRSKGLAFVNIIEIDFGP
jgi:hypothetical protein